MASYYGGSVRSLMMTWFILLGVGLTLGGFCLCCAECRYCTGSQDDSSMTIEFTGATADQDTLSCCTTLNRVYALAIDPDNSCCFEVEYDNGSCLSSECSACDSGGCEVTDCDGNGPLSFCNPANGTSDCEDDGTVSYTTDCYDCAAQEGGEVSLAAGDPIDAACSCTCNATGGTYDPDVDPSNWPPWVVTGEEAVYMCNCSGRNCSAGNGSSSVDIRACFGSSGGNTTLTVTGSYMTRSISGTATITGTPIVCEDEVDDLDIVGDLTFGGFTGTDAMCNTPTAVLATFIP